MGTSGVGGQGRALDLTLKTGLVIMEKGFTRLSGPLALAGGPTWFAPRADPSYGAL